MDVAAHISIDYWLIWHARFSKTIDNKGFSILQLPHLNSKFCGLESKFILDLANAMPPGRRLAIVNLDGSDFPKSLDGRGSIEGKGLPASQIAEKLKPRLAVELPLIIHIANSAVKIDWVSYRSFLHEPSTRKPELLIIYNSNLANHDQNVQDYFTRLAEVQDFERDIQIIICSPQDEARSNGAELERISQKYEPWLKICRLSQLPMTENIHDNILVLIYPQQIERSDLVKALENQSHSPSKFIKIALSDGPHHESTLAAKNVDIFVRWGKESGCYYRESVYMNNDEPSYEQGMYTLELAPGLFELAIENAEQAHRRLPPSSRISVRHINLVSERYLLQPPTHQFLVDRPVYRALRILQERLGRPLSETRSSASDRFSIRQVVNNVWPSLLELQAQVDDWQNEEPWEGLFEGKLPSFRQVFCTDRLGPISWINPRLLKYLAGQFDERKKRRAVSNNGSIFFSKQVLDALNRTQWFEDPSLPVERPDDCGELEIVRILLWDPQELRSEPQRTILEFIDAYHRLFDVPLLFLPVEAATDTEEFIIGIGAHELLGQSFKPSSNMCSSRATPQQAQQLKERFFNLLEAPDLRSVQAVDRELRE